VKVEKKQYFMTKESEHISNDKIVPKN